MVCCWCSGPLWHDRGYFGATSTRAPHDTRELARQSTRTIQAPAKACRKSGQAIDFENWQTSRQASGLSFVFYSVWRLRRRTAPAIRTIENGFTNEDHSKDPALCAQSVATSTIMYTRITSMSECFK